MGKTSKKKTATRHHKEESLEDLVESSKPDKYTNITQFIVKNRVEENTLSKIYETYDGRDINDGSADADTDRKMVRCILRNMSSKISRLSMRIHNDMFPYINEMLNYDMLELHEIDFLVQNMLDIWEEQDTFEYMSDDVIYTFIRLYNKCSDDLKKYVFEFFCIKYDCLNYHYKLNCLFYDMISDLDDDDENLIIDGIKHIKLENIQPKKTYMLFAKFINRARGNKDVLKAVSDYINKSCAEYDRLDRAEFEKYQEEPLDDTFEETDELLFSDEDIGHNRAFFIDKLNEEDSDLSKIITNFK